MREIAFSIPVSGLIRIEDGSITIRVNQAETNVRFEPEAKGMERFALESGRTMFDLVLEAARNVVRQKGENRFSAAELYHEALGQHSELKRNSFTSHVIACAPNHPSYRHYTAKRDYFSYIGEGLYRLSGEYVTGAST